MAASPLSNSETCDMPCGDHRRDVQGILQAKYKKAAEGSAQAILRFHPTHSPWPQSSLDAFPWSLHQLQMPAHYKDFSFDLSTAERIPSRELFDGQLESRALHLATLSSHATSHPILRNCMLNHISHLVLPDAEATLKG